MIVAVADLHLGSQLANKSGFTEFIYEFLKPNQDEISRIVLLGDILDFWRNTNSQVMLQNLDILAEIGRLDMKKNYIVGNHDYAIFNLLGQSSSAVPSDSMGVLDQVTKTLELRNYGLNLKFIHGHQVDYWSALEFYEIFSQAMCFVDTADPDLSDVWNIIHRFAEGLPEETRKLVRDLSKDKQDALEEKLAGPLNGIIEEEKRGLLYEWELLLGVSNFEEVAKKSSMMLSEITKFSKEWEQMLRSIDQYPKRTMLPPLLENDVHQKRREAAAITVGLQEDNFLIRGHGHTPYISEQKQIADVGCWLGDKGSYVKIEDGQVTVHQW